MNICRVINCQKFSLWALNFFFLSFLKKRYGKRIYIFLKAHLQSAGVEEKCCQIYRREEKERGAKKSACAGRKRKIVWWETSLTRDIDDAILRSSRTSGFADTKASLVFSFYCTVVFRAKDKLLPYIYIHSYIYIEFGQPAGTSRIITLQRHFGIKLHLNRNPIFIKKVVISSGTGLMIDEM